MTEEKKLGVKEGDETPTGTDQPEAKDTEDSPDSPDLEKEIDTIVGDETPDEDDLKEDDVEDLGDGTVVLSKDKLEKLKKKASDGTNYRKGLLGIKSKLKKTDKTEKEKATPEKPAEADGDSEFVKKTDLDAKEQKAAIAEAEKNPVIDQNWDVIMNFYRNPGVGSSQKEYEKAIKQAFILWKDDTGYEEEESEEDGTATSDLATEKNKPTGDSTDDGKKKKRKSVLPKKQSASEWYGSPEEKKE